MVHIQKLTESFQTQIEVGRKCFIFTLLVPACSRPGYESIHSQKSHEGIQWIQQDVLDFYDVLDILALG